VQLLGADLISLINGLNAPQWGLFYQGQPVVVAGQQDVRTALSCHEARDVKARAETLAFAVEHDRADRGIGG